MDWSEVLPVEVIVRDGESEWLNVRLPRLSDCSCVSVWEPVSDRVAVFVPLDCSESESVTVNDFVEESSEVNVLLKDRVRTLLSVTSVKDNVRLPDGSHDPVTLSLPDIVFVVVRDEESSREEDKDPDIVDVFDIEAGADSVPPEGDMLSVALRSGEGVEVADGVGGNSSVTDSERVSEVLLERLRSSVGDIDKVLVSVVSRESSLVGEFADSVCVIE